MLTRIRRNWNRIRFTHLAIALGATMVLSAIYLFEPIDIVARVAQARFFPKQASGDIVFVGVMPDDSQGLDEAQRLQLAGLVGTLERAGAAGIYVDIPLERRSSAGDTPLRRSIAASPFVHLVDQVAEISDGPELIRSAGAFETRNDRLFSRNSIDAFNYAWTYPGDTAPGSARIALPFALAGIDPRRGGEVPIDYAFAFSSIPKMGIGAVPSLLRREPGALAGKRIVIGYDVSIRRGHASIPGHRRVAPSMVAIYAAETLKAGPPDAAPKRAGPVLVTLILLCAMLVSGGAARRSLYGAAGLVPVLSFLAMPLFGLVVDVAPAITLLAIFAILRGWWNVRHRSRLVSDVTGLPTFRALENRLARTGANDRCALVIARIHRFDEVLATLPKDEHRDFVQAVADRLRVAEEDLEVHSNDGRYLAWMQATEGADSLGAHLHGLRALFSHPLRVGGVDIDVGMTLAADFGGDAAPSQRLANAVVAVDSTTEAEHPVRIAAQSTREERLWKISLQSKIDKALQSGEIYPVFQPQYDIVTGEVVGFEALVRWNDAERGFISPNYFIEQCEQAGRMECLTREVLDRSARAFLPFCDGLPGVRVSVNMSATLLGSVKVVDMLVDVLQQTGLAPDRLTIEITETARIADFDTAEAIMGALRNLGVALSIDDFGVGAANFETLWRLPFDEIKIDRLFVSRMVEDDKARAIVTTMVRMARAVGARVIAEGIENERERQALIRLGCTIGQGFGLARPEAGLAVDRLTFEKERFMVG